MGRLVPVLHERARLPADFQRSSLSRHSYRSKRFEDEKTRQRLPARWEFRNG